jgi:hypothetical protein
VEVDNWYQKGNWVATKAILNMVVKGETAQMDLEPPYGEIFTCNRIFKYCFYEA